MQGIAAFLNSHIPRFVPAPEPAAPGEGEVLCKTVELGICGTDREILLSKRPWVPHREEFLILGHECLGRIEEAGPGVTEFAQGDLVVPIVRRAFNTECLRADMLPFGQFTERGIVNEHGFSAPWWRDRPRYLFRITQELAPYAVFTEPLSIAEKGCNEALAIQRGRLGPDAWQDPPPRVLVTGLGPIAFAGVLAAISRGWPVAVYGRDKPDTFRARLVEQMGGKYISAEEMNFTPADVEREGYDLILECTGSDEVIVTAAQTLASLGVMVWLGSSRVPEAKEHNVDRYVRDGLLRNQVHVGCVNSAPRDFLDALAHLEEWRTTNRACLDALFTARVPQPEALWHYENRRPQGIKTVVMYE